jgi:hypothetical protein
VRKPEIAYASTRIRPFSLAPGPAGCLAKIELPKLEFTQAKEETEQRDKYNEYHSLPQVFETKCCLFTWPRGPYTNIQTKKGLAPSNLQA